MSRHHVMPWCHIHGDSVCRHYNLWLPFNFSFISLLLNTKIWWQPKNILISVVFHYSSSKLYLTFDAQKNKSLFTNPESNFVCIGCKRQVSLWKLMLRATQGLGTKVYSNRQVYSDSGRVNDVRIWFKENSLMTIDSCSRTCNCFEIPVPFILIMIDNTMNIPVFLF